eukprot:5221850-Amphidinium_carterae.1
MAVLITLTNGVQQIISCGGHAARSAHGASHEVSWPTMRRTLTQYCILEATLRNAARHAS